MLIAVAAVAVLINGAPEVRTDRSAAQRAADLERERSGEAGATYDGRVADVVRIGALVAASRRRAASR